MIKNGRINRRRGRRIEGFPAWASVRHACSTAQPAEQKEDPRESSHTALELCVCQIRQECAWVLVCAWTCTTYTSMHFYHSRHFHAGYSKMFLCHKCFTCEVGELIFSAACVYENKMYEIEYYNFIHIYVSAKMSSDSLI